MELGSKYTVKITVEEKDTAKEIGSGTLRVLATPRMIALMEEAAYKCIGGNLENGSTSVGTFMNVKHLSATPVGMEVTAVAEITEVDGRRVAFKVEAYDETGLIGEGSHERFIVGEERFVSKTYAKINK